MISVNIINQICEEREAQDILWGKEHDDQNSQSEWIALMTRHLGLAVNDGGQTSCSRYRKQLIRVAALAIAAIESLDRREGREKPAGRPAEDRGPEY